MAEALEAEAALEGSWVFLGSDDTEKGPFTRTELLFMYRRYSSIPLSSQTHNITHQYKNLLQGRGHVGNGHVANQ